MDWELLLIFSFIITIILIGVTTAHIIHRRTNAHEERKLELKARIEEAKAAQSSTSRQSNEKLEDRVRVLERIATDRGADLALQIENLRENRNQEMERTP